MKHARKKRAKKPAPVVRPPSPASQADDSGSESESEELNLEGPFSFNNRDDLYVDFGSGNVFQLPDPENPPTNPDDAIVGKIQSTRSTKAPRYSATYTKLQYAKVNFHDDAAASDSDSDEQ